MKCLYAVRRVSPHLVYLPYRVNKVNYVNQNCFLVSNVESLFFLYKLVTSHQCNLLRRPASDSSAWARHQTSSGTTI